MMSPYCYSAAKLLVIAEIILSLLNGVKSQRAADAIMEFAKFHLLEDDFTLTGRPSQETSHKLIFAIKQRTELIESILLEVSDPTNVNYGQHLTRDQVI